MKYASVIIDIVHEKLDQTFQYRIPAHMQQENLIGASVLVPFGNKNRTMHGFVIDVSDTPEFEESRLKDLIDIDKGKTSLESRFIQLAYWIRETYGSTMIQALKVVLPVKNKVKGIEKKQIALKIEQSQTVDKIEQYKKKHAKAKVRLLQALLQQPCLPMETVTKTLAIGASTLQAMIEEGVIEKRAEQIYRNPVSNQQEFKKIELNACQQSVVDEIMSDFGRQIYQTYLLYGVTGSGKTEVYVELIDQALALGKQAIVLIPEIALTYQTVGRFTRRFANQVSVLHSKLSNGERYDQMQRARSGQIRIMIGPRSALFTPFTNLGLIIIDEEHEQSYKSEQTPKYHARETAIEYARLCGASVVLASATPSVESYCRAQAGEYKLLSLPKRALGSAMAKVQITDMRKELKEGNRSIFSRSLKELMFDRLKKKQQIMLFLNRRGYAGFVSCRSCGAVIKCPHCDVALSLHADKTLVCHYCGYVHAPIRACPVCASVYIGGFKAGTQQIESLVKKEFPNARALRMDTDTTRGKHGHEQIVKAFANQEADILIGTQMIVKGHDFPNVTLVGVLAADLSLNGGGYTGSERTFQLLTQAAGRAGRGSLPGEVVIQTYSPEHYSIVCAANQDYEAFYQEEIAFRKLLCYPPAGRMLEILISSISEEKAVYTAGILKNCILALNQQKLQVIGPAAASVAKVKDRYRQLLYLKAGEEDILIKIRKYIEVILKRQTSEFHECVQVQFDYL